MLVNRNNRNGLHKNRVLFPKDENFVVLSTNMAPWKPPIRKVDIVCLHTFLCNQFWVAPQTHTNDCCFWCHDISTLVENLWIVCFKHGTGISYKRIYLLVKLMVHNCEKSVRRDFLHFQFLINMTMMFIWLGVFPRFFYGSWFCKLITKGFFPLLLYSTWRGWFADKSFSWFLITGYGSFWKLI